MPDILYALLGGVLVFLVIGEVAGSLWSTFWEYVR